MGQRPKRRKSKDNPYTLLSLDRDDIYKVSFKDSIGVIRVVEITKEVYEVFDRFELDDLSQLNEFDNHIEHSEIFENNLYDRAKDKPISVEDEIIRKSTFEELKSAIDMLPSVQKRRIKLYYFDDMSTKEIAIIEKCSQHSVRVSIRRAINELKKILKK